MFYVHEVGKFNGKDLRYFMPTKWKALAGVLYDI